MSDSPPPATGALSQEEEDLQNPVLLEINTLFKAKYELWHRNSVSTTVFIT